MATLATWDKITGALGSTDTTFGGGWGNLISDFMNGTDVGLTDPTKRPRPNTLTRWKHEKFGLFDGDESHYVTFSVNDIDTGDTRKIVIRRMNSPNETDYMMMENMPQAMISKDIDSDLNNITNLVNADIKVGAGITDNKLAQITDKAKLHSALVYTDQANTFDTTFLQTFRQGMLALFDSDDSHKYTITTGNLAGNFNLNIPAVTANDTFAFLGLAQTFSDYTTFRKDAVDPVHIYRPANTAANKHGIYFDAWDSAGATKTYAALLSTISVNTAGAESGELSFQLRSAGAFAEKMFLTNTGNLGFGGTNKVTFDVSTLSNARTIAIPNAGGNMVLSSITNTFGAQQIISLDTTIMLLQRRINNTVGSVLTGYYTELRDSASNNTTYAKIETRIGTNTDTNETGFLDFYTMKNGTLGQYLVLDGNQLSLGLSGLRAVLDSTGISGSSKTFTFPNLTGQLTTQEFTNIFSAIQKIAVNNTSPLTLHKPINTAFTQWGIDFNALDSASAEATYAKIWTSLEDNTSSSKDSYIGFSYNIDNSFVRRFFIGGNQIGIGPSGNQVVIPNTGMTADRTFTFPDDSGQVLTDDAVQTPINKEMDAKKNTFIRHSRYGAYRPSEAGPIARGEGALLGISVLGTRGSSNYNTGGKYDVWNTRAVANDVAGLVKLDSFISQRASNPVFRFAFMYDGATTNQRIFKGVGAKRLLTLTSATEPLLSSESGFLFGYDTADTQFQIFHNDATGTCVKTTTGVNIPAVATNYILEISGTSSGGGSFTWTLWGVGGTGEKSTQIGTGTITTRIPGSNTPLYFQDLFITTNASIQPTNIHYVEVFI